MTDVMQDLLIDFDEMGFLPSTSCSNPDKYACEWKGKLIAEINRQQEQLEAAANGQETLQKALAEKEKEIERLKNELFCIANERDSIADCINEAVGEARAEAIREFAERLKSLLALNKQVSNESYYYITTDIDNLVKEIVGDAE